MSDHTVINTGYGQLPVPSDVLRLWNQYGWPTEDALRRMTEAGTVEVIED